MKRTQRSGTGTRGARAEKANELGPAKATKGAGNGAKQGRSGGKGEEKAAARGRTTTRSPARSKANGSKSRSKARSGAGGGAQRAERGGQSKRKGSRRAKEPANSVSEDAAQARDSNGSDDDLSDVAFPAGAYLAFLDPSADDRSPYRLGLVLEPVREEDKELSCDVFTASKEPLHFKRVARQQMVPDLSVVAEVKVVVVESTGKGKKDPELVKMNKQQDNKVTKLLPGVLRNLEAHNAESDSDEDDGENDEESEEEAQVATAQEIQSRRIVRVKGAKRQPAASQRVATGSQKAPANRSKASKSPAAKSRSPKKAAKKSKAGAKASQDDDEMQDEKDSKDEVGQINSSSKPAAKPSATRGSKRLKVPEIGKKRRKGGSEQDDDGEDDEAEASDRQDQSQATEKKRRVGTGKGAKVESIKQPRAKVKKPPAKPTVYKKGKWNPDIELIKIDTIKESDDANLLVGCCTRCNNRNVHRAAMTGNGELLRRCRDDTKNITNLNAFWSPELQKTPVEILLERGDAHLLESLLRPKLSHARHQTYQEVRDHLVWSGRAADDPYLMQFIETGMVSRMAYGTHVRAVQMTRGNRQGNNAFLQYKDQIKNPLAIVQDTGYLKRRLISVDMFKTLEKLCGGDSKPGLYDFKQTASQFLHEAVRVGDRKLVAYVIKDLYQHTNYGYNELHYLVLGDYKKGEKLAEFKSVNVQKKAHMNLNITPLHFACINPNVEVLAQLLDVNSDFNMQDTEMRRPVHYAAACETSDGLKLLLEKGANLADIDMKKVTCLHVAAQARRPDNIRFILSKNDALLKLKDKSGKNAMAYACENGDLESIKALLEHGAMVNQGVGTERQSPLSWAAALGLYELCEWLLDNKARVLGKDKFKRCPLALAVRNGHLKVASLLLQRGADWNQPDSSSNTPLHYAAAYGWPDCIDLLLKAGADINAENSWRVTPINIAMLKNHEGCVKKFLEYPGVDVNGKDEKGRTLLTLSLLDLTDRTVEFVKYLLDKGADPNTADVDEQAALHYLAKLNLEQSMNNSLGYGYAQNKPEEAKELLKRRRDQQLALADLLLARGASLTKTDVEKRTPFALCLECGNIDLLEKLIDEVSLNKDPMLLHALSKKILNVKYQEILRRLLDNDEPSAASMNVLNDDGLTPFLAYIEFFCSRYPSLSGEMMQLVNAKAREHGLQFDKYKLNNESLFEKTLDNDNHNLQSGGRFGRQVKHAYPIQRAGMPTFGGQPAQFNAYGQGAQLNQNSGAELDVVQKEVPAAKRSELTSGIMDKHVVQPFLKCLSLLIEKGADPHALVQKLKYYRELDEEKRKMAMVKEAAKANGQQAANMRELEGAKKREEVLKEREASRQGGKKAQKKHTKQRGHGGHLGGSGPGGPGQPGAPKQEVLEYHATMGLQNAFHLAVACPHSRLVDLLVDLKVNPDEQDRRSITPMNLASTSAGIEYVDPRNNAFTTRLITLGVRTDLPDAKGRTPFLNYYGDSRFDEAERMLSLGANVNQMDASGLYALKYALIRRSGPAIEKLVKESGADINKVDGKGRNLLHHAVNMSSATADATFEIEQQLIDLGIDINLRDQRHRTPLHYAFVKIKGWRDTQQIDPIETVSSLCGCKGLEIDVPDKWQRTPLHYASQRGASICAMYIQKRGANLEAKDIYGNTPLGVALLAMHHNFGIIMIQKEADVKQLVYVEDPERIARLWKEEEEKQLKKAKIEDGSQLQGDEEMEEDADSASASDDHGQDKKHRHLFDRNRQANQNHGYGSEDDYDDEDDDMSDEDSDDQFEQNVFNAQNAFGTAVFARKAPAAGFGFGGSGGGNLYAQGQPNHAGGQAHDSTSAQKNEPQSMFRISIKHQQLGLAYLMLDQGYDLMHAMQDALDEQKFQLVLTLLAKNPDDGVVRGKNSKGQNLFHILCQNSRGCKPDLQRRIFDVLKKRGVDCLVEDGFARTALHYAVESGSTELVDLLLDHGGDPAAKDMYGHSPLTVYLKGKAAASLMIYFPATATYDRIFEALAKKGADMNAHYPEKEFKPAYHGELLDQVAKNLQGSYDCEHYLSTVLINLVRQLSRAKGEADQNRLRHGIMGLLQFGARLDVADSDGRDAMAHAIMSNNQALVELLINNREAGGLNSKVQDVAGKSAVHFVVNPVLFGSYENAHLLAKLAEAGYDLQAKDANGKEPIDYAMEQQSGVLFKKLKQLTNRPKLPEQPRRLLSSIRVDKWPEQKVDFEEDSSLLMKAAQEKEEKEMEKDDKMKELVPVDKTGQFEKSYRVYCEGKQPWDAYLTKVDLRNGIYGDYVFYKMQLLHDSVRDLFVVFTRWGRIGEQGMNQRTPFNNLEEAKKEFCSIFKSKAGNDFTDLDNFLRVEKKYSLTKVNYATVAHQDYLAPFDFEKCSKSRLEKNVRELFEEVSNITMYQKAMNQLGLDTEMLPISGVSKETINKAKELLRQIREQVDEDQKISQQGMQADLGALATIREKISELSSRYYELIPLERYKNQIAPRLSNMHMLKQRFDELDALTNIEQASKVLLGALYRQSEVHPVDYIHHSLNLLISFIDPKSPEHQVIEGYIKNTSENQVNFATHRVKIFKIQRKGEAEAMETFSDVENRRLLFHGSSLFNFIGILLQGMRIAPPEAPATGAMFGKGVYFADMFSKSHQYSQGRFGHGQGSSVLLLCETALGNCKKLWRPEAVEKLEQPYHSVHGVGRIGPDYNDSLIFPNGVEVPTGPQIEYKDYEPQAANNNNNNNFFGFGGNRNNVYLQHNEFVVYNTAQIRMRYLVQLVKKTKEELREEKLHNK